MIKRCHRCEKDFKTKKSHYAIRKYCSKKCMDIARQTHELRNCRICYKQFKFYSSASVRGAIGEYCSLQCKGIGMRKERIKKTCALCKKEFQPSLSYEQKKFCSIECYGQSMAGNEKPSFWEVATKEEQMKRLKSSFEKYVIRNEDGCWGWKGCLSKKYGSLQYGGKYKSISAHRASWLIHKGEIPEDLFICHTCDNPVCTKPEHLFLGTPTDNVLDMIKKGRNKPTRGEKSASAKLNEAQVIQIKELLEQNESMTQIAKKFGVHIVTIHDIKYKKTWSHIQ